MNQDQVHDLVPLTTSNWSSDLSVGSLGYPQNASPVASFIDITDAGTTTRQLVLVLSNGQTRTYTVTTGQRLSVQFSTIKSTTTIAACHLGFGSQVGGFASPFLNASGSLPVQQATASGSLQTLLSSQSLTLSTDFTSSILFGDGAPNLMTEAVFTDNGPASPRTSGSFGWQRSIDGTNWENVFASGLQPSTFVIVSGSQVNGVDNGSSTTAIAGLQFLGANYDLRFVGRAKASAGSVSVFFKKTPR